MSGRLTACIGFTGVRVLRMKKHRWGFVIAFLAILVSCASLTTAGIVSQKQQRTQRARAAAAAKAKAQARARKRASNDKAAAAIDAASNRLPGGGVQPDGGGGSACVWTQTTALTLNDGLPGCSPKSFVFNGEFACSTSGDAACTTLTLLANVYQLQDCSWVLQCTDCVANKAVNCGGGWVISYCYEPSCNVEDGKMYRIYFALISGSCPGGTTVFAGAGDSYICYQNGGGGIVDQCGCL